VLQGDALDKDVLLEAQVDRAETVIAVTNDDETNIFASVLAKREGCSRAITLVNKSSYESFLPTLGIDAVVSPNAITISTILRHLRPLSISGLYTLREDFGEVIEATALEGSRLVQGALREIGTPDGMLIGAIVRKGDVIIPNGSTQVQSGDNVIAVVTYQPYTKPSGCWLASRGLRAGLCETLTFARGHRPVRVRFFFVTVGMLLALSAAMLLPAAADAWIGNSGGKPSLLPA
jgi:trk system potassium uptake protein TrkA